MLKGRAIKILAAVAVFLVVFYSVIAVWGALTPAQHIIGTLATPFRWVFSAVGNTVEGFGG